MLVSNTMQTREHQQYCSPNEITTFLLCESSETQYTTRELHTKLKSQLKASSTTLIAYFRDNSKVGVVIIYDINRKQIVSTIHEREVTGVVFLNSSEVVIACSNNFCLYDLLLNRCVQRVNVDIKSLFALVTMNDCVISNVDHTTLFIWNTRTNTTQTLDIHKEIVEIVPLNSTRFMVCHNEDYFTITDVALSTTEIFTHDGVPNITCDIFGDKEILIAGESQISNLNLETAKVTLLVESGESFYYIHVVDKNRVLLLNDDEETYLCDLRSKELTKLFAINSSNYFPFCVKGPRVYYCFNNTINEFNLNTMEVETSFSIIEELNGYSITLAVV